MFTDGVHPFGHHFRRQGNILDNKLEITEKDSKKVPAEFLALIKELILPYPRLRPAAELVLTRIRDLVVIPTGFLARRADQSIGNIKRIFCI